MATYPIKVLLDRNRQPFIPFATTSSIVENGTNRRLDKILGNLDDLQTNNKNSLVSAINEILVGSGSGAGINIQIVDELPTDNISLTTIYFKHMATGKLHNVYEEWMYINDAWELIGTTEMDLSGYATTAMVGDLSTLKTTDKDSVVDAVNELVDTTGSLSGSINSLSEYHDMEVIKLSGIGPGNSILKADYQKFADALNRMLKFGRPCPIYLDGDLNYYKGIYVCTTNFKAGSSFAMFGMLPVRNSSSHGDMCGCSMTIHLSWSDNNEICTVTGINTSLGSIIDLKDAVTKSNSQTITGTKTFNTLPKSSVVPTDDTHLVNKKYVDDTVAAAGGGSGSAFDPAKYLAIDNTTEYTPTDLYHPATKAYVDSQIASVPEPVDAYNKTEIDGMLSNYLSKTNTESYTPTSDYHPATKKFVESVVASIDTSGFITDSNISEHLANYITETTLNERLMKVPYIMTPNVSITSDHASSDYWGDNTLICNINNTDWLGAIQKIAQAILSKNWPKVYLPISVFPNVDDFNRTQTNKMFRRHFLMELKPSNLGYFADEISHTYTSGDELSTYLDGHIDLGIYGTLNVSFSITYQYDGTSWTYSSYSNPYAYLYIGRVTPVSSLNLTFDNKQIVHSYTEGYKHSRIFSSQVTGCKNLPVNATTKIADLAGTSTLPDGLSTKCELLGTTVSGDVTTYTPLGEATVFVSNNEMYMKVPDITTTDYTDVVCTISMTYED